VTFDAAGHSFIAGRCGCGRLWIDIRTTPKEWIGQTGIHHEPDTTLTEYQWGVIDGQRKREEEQLERAMGWLAR
jgi:hypothetical protein